ncbi:MULTISPECIES: sigma-54-dependent Fis family transcriptional regulator [unclassified Herbaspirillum]|uniref:sigma-54-dependent Fis family transcriptional regulator n=1 Tax=unclassified Herbaspirillum TaxID=2624150 RepID=UPI0018334777|nr:MULTISPECIES: sigma-54-dependent Fis family transcriptional regulator [unclassified Herbaspirillum]MBB5393143.1 transcriptional regulator of acetoin/glycerol metabolism [Herbaspirillum sp. SJZ102]
MIVEESRQRSIAHGLSETEAPDYSPIARADFSMLLEQNRTLHLHALPVMETLYEQIINTHNMVILTDVNGLIVHTLGDDDFLEKANRVALQPGVTWSEQSKGTNAIGTAIVEKQPVQIHANEHYLQANHFLTCSAAPISDHQGNVIGVLDVTGDQSSFHKHTMALVRMSAQMIENHIFSAAFHNAITLHFNTRPEFIGTLMEGIASFTPSGRFLSANRTGLFQLGLPLSALQSHTFSSLFGLPISALFDHYRTATPGLLNLCMPSGVRVYGRAQLQIANSVFQHSADLARNDQGNDGEPGRQSGAHAPQPASSQTASQSQRRMSGLRYLNTGDPQVAALIDKVNKVLGRDIPILVMGETGTGKELLAQAIHNDSPRAEGPFVAVNCASIPETLIESELFGYEDGAFTGARKKGAVGKLLQANGGTLFLDEIGDMPFSLQARLLRVLQERMVTPLGSTKSIPVNVELICATNRNLRDLIAKGQFREDLYYRLNGLVVKLPPLRERTDLDIVVEKILIAESSGERYKVAPEIMRLFKQHSWPGNFRQLTNLLRTAIVMAGNETEIQRQHLPDDFLDDVESAQAQASEDNTNWMVSQGANLEQVELSVIQKALKSNGGNVSATARALGVSRNTIYRKIPLAK